MTSKRMEETTHNRPARNQTTGFGIFVGISSSSEADEIPEESIFMTDEETAETGYKRRHSPDATTEKKQKPNATGENNDCACGLRRLSA